MSTNEDTAVDEWLELMESYNLEEIKKADEEWKKQVEEYYKIINAKMNKIFDKRISYKLKGEILDESCM
jgi:acetyl-CoA carboxylase carboxyltransferase component